VKDLRGREFVSHACRIRFYNDKDLDVTAEMKSIAEFNEQVFAVDEILEYRWNRNDLQFKVSYIGVEQLRNTDPWLDAKIVNASHRGLVRAFIDLQRKPKRLWDYIKQA
jgi:hypothetical protein